MLLTLQSSFQSACYGSPDGFAKALAGLRPGQVPAEKALYVHTATVTAALTAILAQAYPAVTARMDPEQFQLAAVRFLRNHPPHAGVLAEYGAGFADELPTDLCPLADWAAHEAYFAADDAVLMPDALALLPADSLATRRLPLVASARLVDGHSAHLTPWLAMRTDVRGHPPTFPVDGPATLLIWRQPDMMVAATLLPAGMADFVRALRDGKPLLSAIEQLPCDEAFPPLLALLLAQGVLAAP